jgi:branched-chain amino acid transport system ATP-binding protein
VRKKVELARALVQMPKLLLLDEPTSGLTYEEKSEFLYYVKEINEKFGITLVVIEHDVKVISSIANRVIALDFGIKVAEGSAHEVLNHPRVIESYLGAP